MMAGTIVCDASQRYPTPLSCGQCGQKQVCCPKHEALGAGPHCDVMAACMSTVGMLYLSDPERRREDRGKPAGERGVRGRKPVGRSETASKVAAAALGAEPTWP